MRLLRNFYFTSKVNAFDFLMAGILFFLRPLLKNIPGKRKILPMTYARLDQYEFGIIPHHYYSPLVTPQDITRPLSEPRSLKGVNFRIEEQLELVDKFQFAKELDAIPREKRSEAEYGYDNGMYEAGDAEMLYNMIRHFKPSRLIEVGSGQSTLMARLAIARNSEEQTDYSCEHTCIEPFEQNWLESLDIPIIRKPVETCSIELFESLEEGDILFIDSSHVVRPQGDVEFIFFEIFPILSKGVFVHLHDVFSPRNYPEEWVLEQGWMWNEQYLLEAFLSFNSEYKVTIALQMLASEFREKLLKACPVLEEYPDQKPGAFWMQRTI